MFSRTWYNETLDIEHVQNTVEIVLPWNTVADRCGLAVQFGPVYSNILPKSCIGHGSTLGVRGLRVGVNLHAVWAHLQVAG
jgi:hypothetical protein